MERFDTKGRTRMAWWRGIGAPLTAALLAFGARAQVTIPPDNNNGPANRKPFGTYFAYERTHMLYTSAEVGGYGTITDIAFYVNSVSSPADAPAKVWIGTSPNQTITAATYAEVTAGMTLMFDGTIPAASFVADEWVNIHLATPFDYSVGSLAIAIETNAGTASTESTSAKRFRWSPPVPSAVRCETWNANGAPPDTPGSLSGSRPNIRLTGTFCAMPFGVTASSVTSGSTSFSWSAPASVPSGGYEWEVRSAGAPGSGASGLVANGSTSSDVLSAEMTATLTPGVPYQLFVRGVCDGEHFSPWTPTYLLCLPPTYVVFTGLYEQGFENWNSGCGASAKPGVEWSAAPITGDNSWRRDDEGGTAGWYLPPAGNGAYEPAFSQGAHSARFHSYYSYEGVQGSMDLHLDLSATAGPVDLYFDHINPDGTDVLDVLLSTDDGATFTALEGSIGTSGAWAEQHRTFTSTSATTVVRLRATSDYGDTDMGVDNLRVSSLITGIAAQGATAKLSMWPNPNRGDQVYLSVDGLAAGVNTMNVDLYDMTGKRLLARTVAVKGTTTLDLNGSIAPGLYVVNISAGGKTWAERLVVQP